MRNRDDILAAGCGLVIFQIVLALVAAAGLGDFAGALLEAVGGDAGGGVGVAIAVLALLCLAALGDKPRPPSA